MMLSKQPVYVYYSNKKKASFYNHNYSTYMLNSLYIRSIYFYFNSLVNIYRCIRHGANSTPELRVNSKIDYLFKKMELESINFELELKFQAKQLNNNLVDNYVF